MRLLSVLAGRFERRLTKIVAGAGFGKTSLLLQALEQNALAPRGTDLWLSCRPEDGFASQFSRALARVTGARPGAAREAHAIAEAIWQRSPDEVALVLDDVHHIAPESGSWKLIEALLDALPANGHLVLASRSEPPISTTRLLSQGHSAEVYEAELAFDETERDEFARLRGISPDALRSAGGWPALLELTADVGHARVPEFLWEEVLAGIDENRRRALAKLAFLDVVDDELAREIAGVESARELFADLPLTTIDELGGVRMHALWRPVLGRYEEAQDPEARWRAAEILRRRAELAPALELGLQISDDDERLGELVDNIAKHSWSSIAADVLEDVLSRLPSAILDSASGQLLQGGHYMAHDARHARVFLERAVEAFAAAGDGPGELQALSALLHVVFWELDEDAVRALLPRFEALTGHYDTHGVHALWSRALVAVIERRARDALDLLDQAGPPGAERPVAMRVLEVIAASDAGVPQRAIAVAEATLPNAPPRFAGPLQGLLLEAEWMCHGTSAAKFGAVATALSGTVERINQNTVQTLASLAHAGASLGQIEKAERLLSAADAASARTVGVRAQVGSAVARAAVLTASGDEAGAAAELRQLIEDVPLAGRPLRVHLRGLPLFYLLCPELRAELDTLEVGPIFEEHREVGRALATLRESGATDRAAGLDWSNPRRLGALIVPQLRDELAVAAVAGGAAAAESALVHERDDPRPTLRRLAQRKNSPITRVAVRLLQTLPVRPPFVLEVRVLGALAILRDGSVMDDAALRRERVRELLQFLVAHPTTTRDAASTALWPEQTGHAAKNNLRVNLTHLQALLEPDRGPKEPTWFLRSDGERLQLDGGDQLDVDALLFDRACAAAEEADRKGVPSVALAHYLDATSAYRGEYMADLPEAVWAEFDRTRLRSRFVRAAVRAGELSLAQGETQRALELGRCALRSEDLSEPAHRLVAFAYRAAGDLPAARRALRTTLQLLVDCEVDPEPETRALASALDVRKAG